MLERFWYCIFVRDWACDEVLLGIMNLSNETVIFEELETN